MNLLHIPVNKNRTIDDIVQIQLENLSQPLVIVEIGTPAFNTFSQLKESDLAIFTIGKNIELISEVVEILSENKLKIKFQTLKRIRIELETLSNLSRPLFQFLKQKKYRFLELDEFQFSKDDILTILDLVPPYSEGQIGRVFKRGLKHPPILGEKFSGRKEIWENFGGQWQQGIGRFADDPVINVYSDENGPYPDFVDIEGGVIEYRGQGLGQFQALTFGNKLLESARLSKEPVRFWHKSLNNPWEFKTWVLVADRTQIQEQDKKGNLVTRILWFLLPIEGQQENTWNLEAKTLKVLDLADVSKDEVISSSNFLSRYWELSEKYSQIHDRVIAKEKFVRTYVRRREIRELVLARAGDTCEFTGCTGMPPDVGKSGKALLQVDHIVDLALGGSDLPSNMIAVCPNCHYAKTHGMNSEKIIKIFKQIVAKKENELK